MNFLWAAPVKILMQVVSSTSRRCVFKYLSNLAEEIPKISFKLQLDLEKLEITQGGDEGKGETKYLELG